MGIEAILILLSKIVRGLAITSFLLATIIAMTHLAVRRGTIAAFGGWAKFVRGWGDPPLRLVEKRVVRSGGNPQDAPGWLIAAAVVLGLILITSVDWLSNFVLGIAYAMRSGVGLGYILADLIFKVLSGALIVRIIGSWIGVGRYTKGMKIFYVLTDWLLEPIRRILPASGMLDFSPMVAYLLLYLVSNLVLQRLGGG